MLHKKTFRDKKAVVPRLSSFASFWKLPHALTEDGTYQYPAAIKSSRPCTSKNSSEPSFGCIILTVYCSRTYHENAVSQVAEDIPRLPHIVTGVASAIERGVAQQQNFLHDICEQAYDDTPLKLKSAPLRLAMPDCIDQRDEPEQDPGDDSAKKSMSASLSHSNILQITTIEANNRGRVDKPWYQVFQIFYVLKCHSRAICAR